MLKRSLQMSLLGLVVLMVLAFTPCQAQAQQWSVYTADQVLSLQPATSATAQFLQGGLLAFNADGRTFLYYPPGYAQLGLPPYIGQYQVGANKKVTFSAIFNSQARTGSGVTAGASSGQLQGVLDLNTNQVAMAWTASSINAGALGSLGGILGPTATFGNNAFGSKQGVARVTYRGRAN